MPSSNKDRVLSLDVLRGFDLFMLVGLQPVLWQILSKKDLSLFGTPLLSLIDHAAWEGFTPWDLVMPLFMFMSGVTIPFSLPKYINKGTYTLWSRILKRVLILYLLGMVVQGNLLALDINRIYFYSNTLQAIAIGYLLTIPIALYLKPRYQIIAIITLLTIYAVPMHLFGDWSRDGNFAAIVDNYILGRFRDGTTLTADGVWLHADWYDYTWIWSSITFCCTVTMGNLAGHMIKNGNSQKEKTALRMLLVGITLIAFSEILGIYHPIIKRIWSSSMTLYSGGWCFILLALFYWWIDVKGHKGGVEWLLCYGCNAISAYMIGEVINFRCIVHSIFHGIEQYIGDWYPIFLTAGNYIILYIILALLYKHRIFLKV